jgi:hypothetical protein
MSISPKEARTIIRKAVKRVPEGEEIRGLNIMPLVAIASILLLAVIFQSAVSNHHALGDVDLPQSRSFDPEPEGAVTLTIAQSAILVEGEPVVPVKNRAVDSSLKRDGALGLVIPRLSRFLGAVRADNERVAQVTGGDAEAVPELIIIADRLIPYRLLFEVIVSARAEEAGFELFRLIVIDPETGGTRAEQLGD